LLSVSPAPPSTSGATVPIEGSRSMTEPQSGHSGEWTFLTNHAHVLLQLALEPDIRLRDIAARVGITERAAHAIISDLVEAGYVARTRIGRRNRYTVFPTLPLRHPLEADHAVGELLALLGATLGPGRHRDHREHA
jgi:DNA-binding MarR family transcriptional regulator